MTHTTLRMTAPVTAADRDSGSGWQSFKTPAADRYFEIILRREAERAGRNQS